LQIGQAHSSLSRGSTERRCASITVALGLKSADRSPSDWHQHYRWSSSLTFSRMHYRLLRVQATSRPRRAPQFRLTFPMSLDTGD
jgi:hypothetical protein